MQTVPTLLAVGTRDELVPANQSDRYAMRLQTRNRDYRFYVLVGVSHGSQEFFMPEMVDLVADFFKKHAK